MAHPIQPEQGARFVLVRQSADQTTATYEASLYQADVCYTSAIALSLEQKEPLWGDVEVTPEDAPALPAWVTKHANALLRQCTNQARKNGTWPRRIRRWRDAPNDTEAE